MRGEQLAEEHGCRQSISSRGGGDVRDGEGREETAASSGDDRSVFERRSVVRRRRTTGENNDVGGEGKHAAQVHLTALLPQPPEVEMILVGELW